MELLRPLRRALVALLVVAFAAGCASPPAENAPGDLHCDGDMDGIPDGQSPVDGANSTCEQPAGEQDTSGMPSESGAGTPDAGASDADASGGMPGIVPT